MKCCYLKILPKECKELNYDEEVLGEERRSVEEEEDQTFA